MILALSFSFKSILAAIWSVTGSAILGGVAALIAKAFKRINIDIKVSELQRIEAIVENAIHYVREQDAIASKTGRGFSTKAKLGIATKFVIDAGIKDLTPEEIEKIIAVVLAKFDLGATEPK